MQGVATSGELAAAATSVLSIGAGTTVEAEPGAALRWRVDAAGVLQVEQTAGAVTYRHAGAHLVIDAAQVAVETDEAFLRVELPMPPVTTRRAMKIGGAAVAAALVAVAVYEGHARLSNRHGQVEARPGDVAVASADQAPTVTAPTAVARETVTAPRRLPDAAARAELRGAIARARAVREARDRMPAGGPAATSGARATADREPPERDLPRGSMNPDEIRTAVREVIPMLAECYTMAAPAVHAGGNVVIAMTVSGEPDVGTAIDDAALDDGDPHMLADPDFAECLRETLLAVEMPPLTTGGRVEIRYPFMFSDGDPDDPDDPDDEAAHQAGDDRASADDDERTATERRARAPAVAAPPADPHAEMLLHASNAARAGRYNDALRNCRKVLARDPGNVQAHSTAAIAACNLKDATLAAAHLARLDGQRASMIRQVCERNGVTVPDAR